LLTNGNHHKEEQGWREGKGREGKGREEEEGKREDKFLFVFVEKRRDTVSPLSSNQSVGEEIYVIIKHKKEDEEHVWNMLW